jgi:hypothetical protein
MNATKLIATALRLRKIHGGSLCSHNPNGRQCTRRFACAALRPSQFPGYAAFHDRRDTRLTAFEPSVLVLPA